MKQSKFKSRKFILTLIFSAITVVMIFADKVDGAIGLGILGAVLGVYKAVNAVEKTNPLINNDEYSTIDETGRSSTRQLGD